MGLYIDNSATEKQLAILAKYDYCGPWNLTREEAGKLLDEIFNQPEDGHEPDRYPESYEDNQS